MSTGPYLYGEGPEPLHTGTPRSRKGLLVGVFTGTVAVAVAAAVALPLLTGSAGKQATETAGVFVAALQKGDTGTAYELLCDDERARLKPGDVAAVYLRPGTGTVAGSSDAELSSLPAQRVEVRWTDGGTVARTFLTVINQSGPHVCGTSASG